MRKENRTWWDRRGVGNETTTLRDQSKLLSLQLWNEYEEEIRVSSILLYGRNACVSRREKPPNVCGFVFFEELGLIQPCMSRELLLGRELSRPPDRYQAMKSTLWMERMNNIKWTYTYWAQTWTVEFHVNSLEKNAQRLCPDRLYSVILINDCNL